MVFKRTKTELTAVLVRGSRVPSSSYEELRPRSLRDLEEFQEQREFST